MLIAGIVGVLAIFALLAHRLMYEKRRRWQPPVWKNIRAIRDARDSKWAGVNEDLDRLYYEQYMERLRKKEAFWAAVADAERATKRAL